MGILDQLSLFSSKPKSLIEGYRNNDVYNAAMAEIENLESKFTIKLGDYKEKCGFDNLKSSLRTA